MDEVAGEDLRVRIARRAQETQTDQCRLLLLDFFDDDFVGRVRIGLVKHHTLMARAFEHGGQGHDADGGKSHHANVPVFGARSGRQRVKLRVAYVDQINHHNAADILPRTLPCQSQFLNVQLCGPGIKKLDSAAAGPFTAWPRARRRAVPRRCAQRCSDSHKPVEPT